MKSIERRGEVDVERQGFFCPVHFDFSLAAGESRDDHQAGDFVGPENLSPNIKVSQSVESEARLCWEEPAVATSPLIAPWEDGMKGDRRRRRLGCTQPDDD